MVRIYSMLIFYQNSIFLLSFLGKYVGNRPIKLRKSTWQERNIDVVKKKMDEKRKMGLR